MSMTWSVHSLRAPHWIRLDDDGLTLAWFPWKRETLPVSGVESHLGHLVDLRENRRFHVGEAKFSGAEKLHRALRVRRTTAGARQGTV